MLEMRHKGATCHISSIDINLHNNLYINVKHPFMMAGIIAAESTRDILSIIQEQIFYGKSNWN
jgi:hypothetical protein